VAGFVFPGFNRDYEFVALRHPDQYPITEGRIASSNGLDITPAEYDQHFTEYQVEHSTALHSVLDGRTYLTGPMARYSLNSATLPASIRQAVKTAGLTGTCTNPFRSIIVRAVELLFACDEALRLISGYRPPDPPAAAATPQEDATGYGCTEAPRGLLYHRYAITGDGTITDVKIVPPTSQNQKAIEADLRDFAAPRRVGGCHRGLRGGRGLLGRHAAAAVRKVARHRPAHPCMPAHLPGSPRGRHRPHSLRLCLAALRYREGLAMRTRAGLALALAAAVISGFSVYINSWSVLAAGPIEDVLSAEPVVLRRRPAGDRAPPGPPDRVGRSVGVSGPLVPEPSRDGGLPWRHRRLPRPSAARQGCVMGAVIAIVLIVLIVAVVVVFAVRSIRLVPQAHAQMVERLGQYRQTLNPGLHMIVPFIDKALPLLDLRVLRKDIPPQQVITRDDLAVSIDTVVYLQVTDPFAATYEVRNYARSVEGLVVTTLRNEVGGMEFDTLLASRDKINAKLRQVLDEATDRWGLRVSRVELKEIVPSEELQEMLQKQARAERDRRAKIITADGEAARITKITEAQAKRTRTLADADADAKKKIARGQADAIATVFEAIHKGHPDQQLLAYSYLQTLPELAHGDANKLWIVPSELGHALEGIGSAFGSHEASDSHPGDGGSDPPEAVVGSTAPDAGGVPSRDSGEPGKVARLPVPGDGAVVPEPRRAGDPGLEGRLAGGGEAVSAAESAG
jgi:regulator of protease activity HflC (stomatin/prohibitin superfamily)